MARDRDLDRFLDMIASANLSYVIDVTKQELTQVEVLAFDRKRARNVVLDFAKADGALLGIRAETLTTL